MQYDARLATILCCIADGLQVMTLSGGKPREGDGFTLLVLLWTSRMRVGIRALGIHDWTSDVQTAISLHFGTQRVSRATESDTRPFPIVAQAGKPTAAILWNRYLLVIRKVGRHSSEQRIT